MVCGLHWHWLHDSAIDAGIVQAVATLVAGVLVALVAWRGLEGWKAELLGSRRVQHAEACLLAADDFMGLIGDLRSRAILVDTAGDPSRKAFETAVKEREEALLRQAGAALASLRQTYRKASFFIAMPDPDPFAAFDESYAQILSAYRMAMFWANAGDDQHARDELARARSAYLGLSLEPSADDGSQPLDPISLRMRDAMDTLEDCLLRFTGGRMTPASLR